MISLNRAFELKKATIFIDISNDLMTEEEAFQYCRRYLCEDILRSYLLKVYTQSKTYDDIGIIDYQTEEIYSEDLDQEQKSAQWQAYVDVEFHAYLNCPSSQTYLDISSFNRNNNNGE